MLARVITLLLGKTKKMCGVEKEGEEGRRRRKKVRGHESASETGSGVEGTHTQGDTRERCQLRGRRGKKKGSM